MFWNISRIYIFLFSIQNIESNCSIILFNFFRIIFFWWKIDSFRVIFIKDLTFAIFTRFFPTSSRSNATASVYWKHLLSFYWWNLLLHFCFLSNQENQYMIHLNLTLFYDIYNTTTEHNRRETHYLSVIPNYFDIYF